MCDILCRVLPCSFIGAQAYTNHSQTNLFFCPKGRMQPTVNGEKKAQKNVLGLGGCIWLHVHLRCMASVNLSNMIQQSLTFATSQSELNNSNRSYLGTSAFQPSLTHCLRHLDCRVCCNGSFVDSCFAPCWCN